MGNASVRPERLRGREPAGGESSEGLDRVLGVVGARTDGFRPDGLTERIDSTGCRLVRRLGVCRGRSKNHRDRAVIVNTVSCGTVVLDTAGSRPR